MAKLSVGIYYGGSDNLYYLTVFGETNGKLIRLNEEPLLSNVQGGYYLGHLNEKIGYGLAVWNFEWGNGEARDSPHYYKIKIYKIQNGKFKQVVKKVSKKKYIWGGSGSWLATESRPESHLRLVQIEL